MPSFLAGARRLLALLVLLLAFPAFGQDRFYTEVTPPLPTDNPAKIEVLEFFYYGCPHCSNLSSYLDEWSAKLPADVAFRRVPVSFDHAMLSRNARLFYAIEATGELSRLDREVFRAFDQRIRLYDEKALTEWLTAKGVDTGKFMEAYRSFGVETSVKRADRLANDYGVRGVPAIAIDGKYLLDAREPNEFLAAASRMIERVRTERGKK